MAKKYQKVPKFNKITLSTFEDPPPLIHKMWMICRFFWHHSLKELDFCVIFLNRTMVYRSRLGCQSVKKNYTSQVYFGVRALQNCHGGVNFCESLGYAQFASKHRHRDRAVKRRDATEADRTAAYTATSHICIQG